jgi:cadmium resistance protein CadD (predicted permease)
MSSNALATRAYLKEFGGAMLAYVILLPLSIVLIQDHPAAPWRWPVALLPVIPVALAFWAILRAVTRMDELQRRIQFEALVVSVGGTIILTFGYGTLQNVGLPPLNLMFVTPLVVALWGLGLAWTSRRYR